MIVAVGCLQLVLLAELIPAHGQVYCGMSLVPGWCCSTKPKLLPKALTNQKQKHAASGGQQNKGKKK
jgi:hypothetical protein